MADRLAPLRRHYEAYSAGDIEGALAVLHPDVRFEMDAESALLGSEFQGRDEVRGFLESLGDVMVDGMRSEPIEVLERGDRVLLIVRLSGRAQHTGLEGERVMAHEWTLRDGQPWRLQVHADADEARREWQAEGASSRA